MAPNPRRVAERLQREVYDRIPDMECKGYCHDGCGPVPVTVLERARLERESGREFTCGAGATCSMLTPDRRCGVYEIRPTLCRLWGTIPSLPCHYGCKPVGGYLSDKEGWELVLRAEQIGGTDRSSEEIVAMIARLQSASPEQIRTLARALTARPSLERRAAALPPTVIHRRNA